ncbi:MAG: ABC transporter ATP-binding protein [Campylobacterales bacterium]
MSVLRVENLQKQFCKGTVCVANRITFEVKEGEIFTLLGESGCGKSTLLRMIAGFEHPDSGTIALEGKTVFDAQTLVPPEKRRVGMVFQNYALFPHMRVSENVAFGLKGQSAAQQKKRIDEVLSLTGLAGLSDRYPHELSGGQQQRVAIARALAPGAKLLLLDEPFSNLDYSLRLTMRQELRRMIKQSGASAIFVTHDQQDAFEISDRIAIMNGGAIEQIGTPKALYYTPQSRYVATFLGQCNLIEGRVEKGMIQTPIGAFDLPNPYEEAQALTLLIRPEIAELSRAAPGLAAQVIESRFLGEHQEVRIRAGQTELLAYAHGLEHYKADEAVFVRFETRLIGVCERLF